MSINESEHNDMTDLERRLSALRPTTGGLDRGRMLYEAGRASALAERRRAVRSLATLTLAMAVLAGGLATAWSLERRRNANLRAEMVAAQLTRDVRQELARGPLLATSNPPPPSANTVAASNNPVNYLEITRRIADGRLDLDPSPPRPRSGERPRVPSKPEPLRVGDRNRLLSL